MNYQCCLLARTGVMKKINRVLYSSLRLYRVSKILYCIRKAWIYLSVNVEPCPQFR